MKRNGEYMMEMFSVEYPSSRYNIDYLENLLDPVYVYYVDGVPILKVWKNDIVHTKPAFALEVELHDLTISGGAKEGFILLELKNPASISRIEIDHDRNSCKDESTGRVMYLSLDEEEILLPDDLFRSQSLYPLSLQTPTHFVYFLTGQKTKQITIIPENKNLCLLQFRAVKIFGLASK
ncbi:MAG: hypothetical protein HYW62_02155 [Candidatus Levybacteria bacterium]|nr:hypothetical protein [Candidatus Levybacteria bacterium]